MRKNLSGGRNSHQFLAQMIASLFGDAQRCLPVIILHVGNGARSQEQSHGLRLVLYHAVMKGSVPLLCPSVEAGGVLDEEVDDVQGAAGFLRDGVMQARLIELLGTEIVRNLFSFAAAPQQ